MKKIFSIIVGFVIAIIAFLFLGRKKSEDYLKDAKEKDKKLKDIIDDLKQQINNSKPGKANKDWHKEK